MNPVFKNLSREELKKLFRNGKLPSEKDFSELIDSGVNKLDDGFVKDDDQGLVIASTGESKKFISFFRKTDELNPFVVMERSVENSEALRITPFSESGNAATNNNSFFFHTNGSLGLGTPADEKYRLQIANGFTGMYARSGTFATGKVPANGKWHPIITQLNNCQAFEVVARTGVKHSGKFAMMHAIAVSTFGGPRARNKVKKVCAQYGFFWNKINLKWSGKLHDYALMLRSNSNYGYGVYIHYHVTRLWDDTTFLPADYYY